LDLDDELRLAELDPQPVALAGELGDLQRVDARGVGLGAALLRRECRQVSGLALASPSAQRRGVHTLAAHQRADLAGLGAQLCGLQNAALVGVGERAAPSA
jgi:hypothetical protein